MDLQFIADDAFQRGDCHAGWDAVHASMDVAFGRDPSMSLDSLTRSDDRETAREASWIYWDNLHDQMRRD